MKGIQAAEHTGNPVCTVCVYNGDEMFKNMFLYSYTVEGLEACFSASIYTQDMQMLELTMTCLCVCVASSQLHACLCGHVRARVCARAFSQASYTSPSFIKRSPSPGAATQTQGLRFTAVPSPRRGGTSKSLLTRLMNAPPSAGLMYGPQSQASTVDRAATLAPSWSLTGREGHLLAFSRIWETWA